MGRLAAVDEPVTIRGHWFSRTPPPLHPPLPPGEVSLAPSSTATAAHSRGAKLKRRQPGGRLAQSNDFDEHPPVVVVVAAAAEIQMAVQPAET